MADDDRMRGLLEIVTAVLLGLVSVATAAGAYQASEWGQESARLEAVAGELRDLSLSDYIANDLAGFDDGERVFDVIALESQIVLGSGDEQLLRAQQDAILAAATPGVLEQWHVFLDNGRRVEDLPLQNAEYFATTLAPVYGSNKASAVAYLAAERLGERSIQLTVSSVVLALALLLLGVAGANRSVKIAFALALGGAVTFVVGIVLSALAVVG